MVSPLPASFGEHGPLTRSSSQGCHNRLRIPRHNSYDHKKLSHHITLQSYNYTTCIESREPITHQPSQMKILTSVVLSWASVAVLLLLPDAATAQVGTQDQYCARVGEKAIACGATNPFRPQKCCGGLVCAQGNVQKHCVEPSDLPPPPMCAAENERAINCGALWASDRAQNCCDGLICHPGNAKVTCVNPINLAAEELYNCAGEGDRAVQCGATIQIGRAQECCEGYICEPGNVKTVCTKKENVAMEDLRVCAAEGERAQECGASSRNKAGCCDGFVCTPGNVKVTCTAKENIPPPPTCAAEGERAVNCGAPALADGSRPKECCGNLICAPGNAKMICVSPDTVDPLEFSECSAAGERAIECGAAPGPGRHNRCCGGYTCSPDRAKVICVSEATIDPVDILKESQTCALEGERALDCGAAPSPGRHKSCCSGFSCTPGNVKVTCTSNENLPKGPTCGTEGIKATSCGAAPAADRPEGCCSGFVCHPGPQSRYCTDATNVTLASTTGDGTICAAEGERAQACGATGASRPAECCPGMMCEFGAGVRCVVDPFAPTAKPTKAPTPLPTRQPTPRPTKSPTLPPTPVPTTAEPTGPHVFGVTCSTAGQRSQQCGAAAVGGGGNERPKACCPGFTCDPRYPGRCVVDPDWVAPTPKPTKKPTVAPTKKPTNAPTPKPTVPPGTPTTSPTAAPVVPPSFTHAIFTSLAISDEVPEAEYAQVGETLASVTNGIIMRKIGFDVEEVNDSGRRLVTLEHDAASLSLVPMNILDQRQEDVGFSWVAYRMSYTVRQFDGLGKNEVKEMIDEGWTESIEDGTLIWDLQTKDPNILGAAIFGQESTTNVRDPADRPTSPPTRDDTVTSTTRGEGSSTGGGPAWWVWLLVGLVGLAIAVALVFFVLAKRRTKKVRRAMPQKGELMDASDSDEVPITQNATFEDSSDEGHGQHPNQAFAPDQTFDATFPAFEVPEDEGKGTTSSSKDTKEGQEWGGDGFSMNDLAKQPGW